MPRIPSKTILAKDAIGQAIELVSVEEARILLRNLRIQYYNLAVNEIYLNLLSLIDVESVTHRHTAIWGSGEFDRHFKVDLSADTDFDSYDSIMGIEIYNDLIVPEYYDVERLSIQEFIGHKKNRKAMPPYDEMFIFAEYNNTLEFLHGDKVDALDSPIIGIYFKRQPTLLTTANYNTLYAGVPDKYLTLLINRIASYAEVRMGITDQAMAMVKMSYEQLLASVEPVLRTKIMNTLQPKGEE